jgi:hypothetical protein
MATQKVAIFYNSGEADSLLSTMILCVRYIAHTVTLVDLIGKSEAQMHTAIDTITDDTQDKVYVTTTVDASFTAKGHLSTDTNIVQLETKIKSTSIAPYNVPVELGEFDTNQAPPLRAWIESYPTTSWPNVVRYLSGDYFPILWATADSAGATALTDNGTFTPDAYNGMYVYIISASTGAGQVREILDSTAHALTVAAWDTIPTGTIVYGVCTLKAEALRMEAIKCYMKGLMFNLTDTATIQKYYRLLDFGSYDSSYNSINNGSLVAPYSDSKLLEEICDEGLKIYLSIDRYAQVTALNT